VNTSDDELYGSPGEQVRFGTVPLGSTDATAVPSPMLSLEAVAQSDEEIYAKYAGELTRFATGLVGPSDAPDVVSSAVLSCMSSRQWPKVVNSRAYLFRGVLIAAHQLHRSDSRRRAREERSATSDLFETSRGAPRDPRRRQCAERPPASRHSARLLVRSRSVPSTLGAGHASFHPARLRVSSW
jgi:DNA-directed RNA polymerase specialized sigma24 family protein